VGYKRPLQKEDLWHYDESRRTKAMADKLTENIEKRRKDGKTKNILFMALNDTFFWQFWTAGLLKVQSHTIERIAN
jgi:ATP-binding cassette, subfamily C (CFTR/MRP), member 1